MTKKFFVALNDQGRFATTVIADFSLVDGAHIWGGRTAETAAELAELVNGALESLRNFGNPHLVMRVASDVKEEAAPAPDGEEVVTDASRIEALLQQNRELQETIRTLSAPKPTLTLVDEEGS